MTEARHCTVRADARVWLGARTWLRTAGLLAALALGAASATAGDLFALSSRPGVTQGVYLDAPFAVPPWVAVLFAGGDGAVALSQGGPRRMAPNFLLRTKSYWVAAGDAAAVFDAPSDQRGGMDDPFRLGQAARQDVAAVVAALRTRFPGAKVALIGTSRGTVTVGNVLAHDPGLADAWVLTSPITVARGDQTGLAGLDWSQVGRRVRVLVVSNEHDGCDVSPFEGARDLAVQGGFGFMAVSSTAEAIDATAREKRKGRCGARSPHGFWGIETQTMGGIRAWLKGDDGPSARP